METVLFASPQEITISTIVGGNVDVDKYNMHISDTQVFTIKPLLGSLLYDKIVADVVADTLTGLYLELVNNYVKPITKYKSVSTFVALNSYSLNNSGLFKNTPKDVQVVSDRATENISDRYSSMAQMYVTNFYAWIALNKLEEYKEDQNGIKPVTININNGWRYS